MKRLSMAVVACFLFALAGIANAEEAANYYSKIQRFSIPERYELIIGYIKPGIKIDEETLAKTLEAIRKEYNAPQVQLAFVAEDKKIGDGVLGLAGVSGKEKPVYLLPKDEEQAKLLAKAIGYDMSPKALWKAYDENEVVADQDFKGRPIIFEATLSEVAKDVFGKPYVKIPVDQHGFFGIQVTLKEDDPALRKIKKGMKVTVRAVPEKFIAKTLMAHGTVLVAK